MTVTIDGQVSTPLIGNDLTVSLQTKDVAEAKRRGNEAQAEFDRIWLSFADQPISLTLRQCVALAGRYYLTMRQALEDEPGEAALWAQRARDWDAIEARQQASAYGSLMIGQRSLEERLGSWVDGVLSEHHLSVDTASREKLLEQFDKAARELALLLERRGSGDYGPDLNAERFPAFEAPEESQATAVARPALTLTQLFERWEKDHLADGKSARTVGDYRQKLSALISYLEHEDAHAITPKDIGRWADHLRHEKGLSAKTVADKYLVVVKRLFNGIIEKGEDIENPAGKITVKVPKKIRERSNWFTDEEANKILYASLHIEVSASNRPDLNKTAIRWVPWICAYTGARCGEITQLRREDLIEEYGIPCLRITPEAITVKTGDYRIVPLHPHLIEMGLPQFIHGQGPGHLFIQNFKPGVGALSRIARNDSAVKMLGKWVRDDAKVTDCQSAPKRDPLSASKKYPSFKLQRLARAALKLSI